MKMRWWVIGFLIYAATMVAIMYLNDFVRSNQDWIP